MCLSIPARITALDGDCAAVDAGGNCLRVNVTLIEGAQIGDYVLVHAGFAIEKFDPQEAQETIDLLKEAFCGDPEGVPE